MCVCVELVVRVCVCCGVGCCVCTCGVWCCVMSCVMSCLVCCVVVVLCGVWVFCFSLSLFLSILFFLFLALSLSCSFLLLSCLPLSLLSSSSFSSLFSSRHQTLLNFEAFACDLAHGRCTAVGYLLTSSPSLLPSPPLPTHKKKRKRELFITGTFPARNLFFITVLN